MACDFLREGQPPSRCSLHIDDAGECLHLPFRWSLRANRAREGFPCPALGRDRFAEGLLLIGRVSGVRSGWLVRSVLLSGATGPNQDHLTVPNHRPVPPATSRPQVIRRARFMQPSRDYRGPHRDRIQVGSDYRGVIPFLANHHSGHLHDEWSRRALAPCRFLEPRRACRSRHRKHRATHTGRSTPRTVVLARRNPCKHPLRRAPIG